VRRAIVTGADGFLGRHLVPSLQRHGVQVTALTRRPRPDAACIAMGDAPWSTTRLANIIETAEPDAIFHLVGGTLGSEAELEQANLGVARSVMQAIRDSQAHPLLVCCGSAAEYGAAVVDGEPVCESAVCAPLTAYGTVKLALTNAALSFSEATGTPVLVTRIFNPIGPGMPAYLALGGFAQQIASMQGSYGVLQTGNLRVFRDFIDVDQVTRAFWLLAQNPDARGVVNVCSGQATELSLLVQILIDTSGKDVAIETVPARLRRWEPAVVIGSTVRMAKLGAAQPVADYIDLVGRIWQHATARQAVLS
jgi:GDP-4-dehydro-6-deoxy-D-mannose reductase